MQPILGRGRDAGLVRAVERVRRRAGALAAPARSSRRRRRPRRAHAEQQPGRAGGQAEQALAESLRRRRAPLRLVAAMGRDPAPLRSAFDSGSDRALTASESALDLVLGQLVVEHEAVARPAVVEQRLQLLEPGRRAARPGRRPSSHHRPRGPRSRPGRRRRWPGSPTGRCATSTPPRRSPCRSRPRRAGPWSRWRSGRAVKVEVLDLGVELLVLASRSSANFARCGGGQRLVPSARAGHRSFSIRCQPVHSCPARGRPRAGPSSGRGRRTTRRRSRSAPSARGPRGRAPGPRRRRRPCRAREFLGLLSSCADWSLT